LTTLTAVCLTHHEAPLEVLECLPRGRSLAPALVALGRSPGVRGALLLSTCNRYEAYLTSDAPLDVAAVTATLAESAGLPSATVAKLIEWHHDADAVAHLFSVAAGLDSRLVGEGEILGQLRSAAQAAAAAGYLDADLATLSQWAVRAGRRARRVSGWTSTRISVADQAVGVLESTLGGLSGRRVLVLGAGRLAQRSVRALTAQAATPVVCARDPAGAAKSLGSVRPVPMQLWPALIGAVDAVICATSAEQPILTTAQLATALPDPAARPVVVIDLAVPRNVEPQAAKLASLVYLDLDALARYDGCQPASRPDVRAAQHAVADETRDYLAARAGRQSSALLQELSEHAETIRRGELARVAGRVTDSDLAVIEEVTRRMVNKLLHPAITGIRTATAAGEPEIALAVAQVLCGRPATLERRFRDDASRAS
jgi:glutamyl-tRNA reductase